ncbi:ArsR/SmtB family transcription factor [Streptomyces sp. 2A115]|uniref:ArsR/SmtB family transcription factor n=1 Tax=Streptomyces sp. 2A115 TaxID=3457439 RepID=UPI003FD41A7C
MTDDRLSQVFSALADPTRRDIVARLAAGDATVNELAEPYDVTVQAVSKHIRVLEDAGLVSRSRDAQRRPCHLEADVFDLMTKWIERYRREAEDRFRRLDAVLAQMDEQVGGQGGGQRGGQRSEQVDGRTDGHPGAGRSAKGKAS